MDRKDKFLHYQAQTGPYPLAIQVGSAKGSYIYDHKGHGHLDFVAGVSACNLGHCHEEVVKAIQKQSTQYLHVMVYGEFILEPALEYCTLLAECLPSNLETTYLVNSGTEAIEASLKLARRATGRSQIIAAKKAYHGNTMGSLSLMGDETKKGPFRPLIPNIGFIDFNSVEDLGRITDKTAAVIVETIQGAAGFIVPNEGYLAQLSKRCKEVGALLIFDEIQPGFGRTGKLFAFEHYNCVPDILVIGKAMASGMPAGALVSSNKIMSCLKDNPTLGHITTFGGNPVIAAASLATLKVLTQSTIMDEIAEKEAHFRRLLKHPLIKEVRGKGLMLALIMPSSKIADHLVLEASKRHLILFWLLFGKNAVRITPPLTISHSEIEKGCSIILDILKGYQANPC